MITPTVSENERVSYCCQKLAGPKAKKRGVSRDVHARYLRTRDHEVNCARVEILRGSICTCVLAIHLRQCREFCKYVLDFGWQGCCMVEIATSVRVPPPFPPSLSFLFPLSFPFFLSFGEAGCFGREAPPPPTPHWMKLCISAWHCTCSTLLRSTSMFERCYGRVVYPCGGGGGGGGEGGCCIVLVLHYYMAGAWYRCVMCSY